MTQNQDIAAIPIHSHTHTYTHLYTQPAQPNNDPLPSLLLPSLQTRTTLTRSILLQNTTRQRNLPRIIPKRLRPHREHDLQLALAVREKEDQHGRAARDGERVPLRWRGRRVGAQAGEGELFCVCVSEWMDVLCWWV